MKTTAFALIVLIAGAAAAGCCCLTSQADISAVSDLTPGQIRTVFQITGMTSRSDAAFIQMVLKRVDGIVAASADHERGTATVTYEREKITAERIVEMINRAAFSASLPKKKASINHSQLF